MGKGSDDYRKHKRYALDRVDAGDERNEAGRMRKREEVGRGQEKP